MSKMEKGISLCLTYTFEAYDGGKKKSLFRIADYIDGTFFPADPYKFSDYINEYQPKFLKYPPEYDPKLYEPVVRSWNVSEQNNDKDLGTTLSYEYKGVRTYEILFDFMDCDEDIDSIQEKFKNGITIPQGTSEDILFVYKEDKYSYRAMHCKMSSFKKLNGKYFLNDRLSDMLHTHHFLKTYEIDKEDIFSTEPFPYLYSENKRNEIRYFYMNDILPDEYNNFYLYELPDYIPFFVSRFMKNDTRCPFTKNQIQRIESEIEKAFIDKNQIDQFFKIAGFNEDTLIEELEDYKDDIFEALEGYDNINNVIANVVLNREDKKEEVYDLIKKEWLIEKENERKNIESEIDSIKQSLSEISDEYEQVNQKLSNAKKELNTLEEQREIVLNELHTGINEFDQNMGEIIKNSIICNYLKSNSVNEKKEEFIRIRKPTQSDTGNSMRIESLDKAIKFMSNNLMKTGLKSEYSGVVATSILGFEKFINSFIISGYYARRFADAISLSIEAVNATKIEVDPSHINYENIYRTVKTISSKVILIENLLDTCNEALVSNLIKNNKSKIIIFSFENDETISILSKNIWSYCLLINSDVLYRDVKPNYTIKKIILADDLEKYDVVYGDEDFMDLNEKLKMINLPPASRRFLIRVIDSICEYQSDDDTEKYAMSIIMKLLSVQIEEVDEIYLEEIRDWMEKDIWEEYC